MAESPLAKLYDAVTTKLMEAGTVKWFDVDLGQVDFDKLPMKYPAALIKIGDVIWRDFDDANQIGVATLSIKIVFRFEVENKFLVIEPGGRKEVRKNLDTMREIHELMLIVSGSGFNKLRRFNQYHLETKSKELLWIHVVQYQCNIMSDGSTPEDALNLDNANVVGNNSFLERRKMSLVYK